MRDVGEKHPHSGSQQGDAGRATTEGFERPDQTRGPGAPLGALGPSLSPASSRAPNAAGTAEGLVVTWKVAACGQSRRDRAWKGIPVPRLRGKPPDDLPVVDSPLDHDTRNSQNLWTSARETEAKRSETHAGKGFQEAAQSLSNDTPALVLADRSNQLEALND